MDIYCIPEAPDYPGLYMGSHGFTLNADSSMKFSTKESCEKFCETLVYKFVPTEHGFYTE